jgi:dTDP-4-dehydrorhamnose reductase
MDSKRRSVIVTGASGQLGRPLCQLLTSQGYTVHAVTRAEVDLHDPEATLRVLLTYKASTIFHCAAMTAVDDCEADRDQAYAVNVHGTRGICRAAAKLQARVIYVSTDYVFDGHCQEGYDEFADPNPRSIYGRSKYFGEKVVLAQSPDNVVVRTSWLFGPDGKNFVSIILELARSGKELSIVSDQRGLPSYAPDLAQKLIEISESKLAGVVHVTNSGEPVSWLDFGREALSLAKIDHPAKAISTAAFGRPAPRPACSVLHSRVLSLYGLSRCRPWREALGDYIAAMQKAD